MTKSLIKLVIVSGNDFLNQTDHVKRKQQLCSSLHGRIGMFSEFNLPKSVKKKKIFIFFQVLQ